jgi:eukaryotic-like serine/threonine-protein kinase
MAILDPLVLPSDVVILPVAQLPPELREQVGHEAGDFSVTRPRSRAMSSIVDAKTAALLETFRTPATIVDAVIAFSAAEGLDPRATLDDAFAVLGSFVNEGLLVTADSVLAQPITTSLAAGDRLGVFEVVEPAQLIVDTEVYRARAPDGSAVALKIARPTAGRHLHAAFAHEAAILDRLDGRVNPRLLELGEFDGRPFLALSWCAGVDAYGAAAEARGLAEAPGRAALLTLTASVIEAYAHLHAQDVIHADVHPRNVLVDAHGAVTIIDFGLATRPATTGSLGAGERGGIDFFLEPEIAAARLAGRLPPPPSAVGEQYSLAALVYLLLTGAHTHSFSLEPEEMLHQLLEQPPLPFDRHGAWEMPAVERTIRRALAKDPSARYRSVSSFARSFRSAAEKDRNRTRPATRPTPAAEVLEDVVVRLAAPGELFGGGLDPPTASIMNGGAGFAYALLRIASIRDDHELLALADVWSTQALQAAGSDEAFWNAELEIVPETFGENSFYHHASGVHLVHALIAGARGDDWAQQLALESFLSAAARPCDHVDVAFGRSGLLLGCSLALEALPATLEVRPLRTLGDGLRDSLWTQLEREPALPESTELKSLGAAHGWAGYLFALMRWSEASGTPLPATLGERLEQLAALGQPAGRGLRWPHEAGAHPLGGALEASWCNGAAGYVYLWTLAHRQIGDEMYARLAEMAAWSAYEGHPAAPGDLCCGFAGRAYSLVCLYKHSGEPAWLARAHRLSDYAARSVRVEPLRRDSLYKGEVGVALLAADLEAPDHACMPFFEAEGWPRRGSSIP